MDMMTEAAPASTALTVVERAVIAIGITAERERELAELAAGSASITAITNGDGREQCHRARMVLKNERIDLEKRSKAARDDVNAFRVAVIAEERRLIALIEPEEQRLQRLQDQWDAARESERRAKEESERIRISEIQRRIAIIDALPDKFAESSAGKIAEAISQLEAGLKFDYQEFSQQAELGRQAAIVALRTSHAEAVEHEERAAAEQAEKDRQEAQARVQREAEERSLADGRAKLEAERAEQRRVDAIREKLLQLAPNKMLSVLSGPQLIAEHIADIEAIEVDESFAEFQEEAAGRKTRSIEYLRAMHAGAIERKATETRMREEQASIERQRKALEEERSKAEAERLAREAQDRALRAAAERSAAEDLAKRERRGAMLARGRPPAAEIADSVSEAFGVDSDIAASWISQTPHEEWGELCARAAQNLKEAP